MKVLSVAMTLVGAVLMLSAMTDAYGCYNTRTVDYPGSLDWYHCDKECFNSDMNHLVSYSEHDRRYGVYTCCCGYRGPSDPPAQRLSGTSYF